MIVWLKVMIVFYEIQFREGGSSSESQLLENCLRDDFLIAANPLAFRSVIVTLPSKILAKYPRSNRLFHYFNLVA